MKLEHIRTFLEIAADGSFSRAAEALNVTQSTVSGRVKAMEEWFGRPLFARRATGVELTSAGQRFRRYAEGIERLWQQSQQQLTLPEGYRTVLALGAQVSLWERLILDWMPRMRRQAPEVALQVQADYSNSLMRQLTDGLLDICVMYQPRQAAGIVIEDLFEETLVMAARTPRAVSPDWVEDYVFVDWGRPVGRGRRPAPGARRPHRPPPGVRGLHRQPQRLRGPKISPQHPARHRQRGGKHLTSFSFGSYPAKSTNPANARRRKIDYAENQTFTPFVNFR